MSHSYGHKLNARYLPQAPDFSVPFEAPRSRWRRVAFQYHATAHPCYPVPRGVVRAMRLVDPLFVPLWVRVVWLSPEDSFVYFDNMVIAEAVRVPKAPAHRDLRNLALPTGGLYLQPHEPLRVMERPAQEAPRPFPGAPGHMIPMDWGLYYHTLALQAAQRALEGRSEVHGDADSRVEQAARQYEDATVGERARRMGSLREEVAYRWEQNWDHIAKNAAALDVDDLNSIGVPRGRTKPASQVQVQQRGTPLVLKADGTPARSATSPAPAA